MQFEYPAYPIADEIGSANIIISAKNSPERSEVVAKALEKIEDLFTPSFVANRKHPVSKPKTSTT